MKKTILDPQSRAAMQGRIAAIRPDSKALWGKMNAAQCLAHLADQFRMALGRVKVAGTPTFMQRTLVRWLVMAGMPAPKGKIMTMPELDQLTAGTKPTEFEADRASLLSLIEEFMATPEDYPYQVHPAFGFFNKKEWGKMMWTHLDHHLTQFGV